ncbi:hypothetical protein OROGR_030392 [Orobanche gracilis]
MYIYASKNDWCIVARIIHLWTVSNCKKSTRVTSIDMILCDKEGIRIHASVYQHFVNKFEKVLKEDSVYQFKGFSVSASRGEYQAAKHDCKIYFHANTKVGLLPDNMVPSPSYVFAAYPEILEGLHDSSYLIV